MNEAGFGVGELDTAEKLGDTYLDDSLGVDPASVDEGSRLSRFYGRHRGWLLLLISLGAGVILWQIAARFTSPLVFVPLEDIYQALLRRIERGRFFRDLLFSAQSLLLGLFLATVVGIFLGVIIAANETVHDLLDPWISALYSTPLVALAPLFIFVFGIGIPSKVAMVFLLSVFPILINTSAGIRTAGKNLIEAAYSFGASKRQIFTKVLVPSAVPFIVAGERLAIGRGLAAVVVAEFFGARAGIGAMIFNASQSFDAATVWLGVIILAVIGTLGLKGMTRLERRLAPWREFKVP